MIPPILLYTHSEYSFIWKATISLLQKYTPECIIYWCADSLLDFTLPSNFIFHKYDLSDSWSYRVKGCLDKIESKYVIYIQEDWLLVDYIYEEKISYLIQYMDDNNIDFLMSCVRGYVGPPIKSKYKDYVFRKIYGHYFQPAIWRKTLLTEILKLNIPLRVNETNEALMISQRANCYAIEYTKTNDITLPAMYFPHMHAIYLGTWCFRRYPYLKALLESYGIDTTTRPVCNEWILDYQ